jgi:hypothetical protein
MEEVREMALTAVTCKADAAVLYATCDAGIHDANPLARRHARVPVAPIGFEAATPTVEAMLFGTGEAAEEQNHAVVAEHQQHVHHHTYADGREREGDRPGRSMAVSWLLTYGDSGIVASPGWGLRRPLRRLDVGRASDNFLILTFF